ncbi:sugar transferase [Cryobacterium algoritolerans]|uniref:Sugar transferase n=1 Tax=Cryobacterium algoritolerans TaxID=1259184 RepID=A0A4R8WLB6_9MICO|nr:sugar transferase [Cryobacterium algoritolerans]TFC12020.1 sugar transferase [Cryobacterium algoritolerans]
MSENPTSIPIYVDRKNRGRDWRGVYAARLVITDLLVLIWVVFGVQILWFGLDTADLAFRGNARDLEVNYTSVSVMLIVAWMAMLGAYGTRGYRVLGTGADEYKLIANASFRLFGLLAISAFLLQIDVARGYILIALPLGVVILIFSRWMWRQWLGVQRQRGLFSSTVLLVGSAASATHLARVLRSSTEAGYRVVGACVPSGRVSTFLSTTDVPVFGDFDDLQPALAATGADTVVVTSSDDLPPERIRQLSWALEPGRKHLVVAPSLTGIGGPRIHARPVAGLPLIHVEMPSYEGLKHFAKRAFDIAGSGLLLLLFSPTLVVIALVVRLTSSGPVLYRQERIGLNGEPFNMLKFRSMTVDADSQLASLLEAQGTGNKPLFKVSNDPRLTKVGGFLRRYSLDELLQLLNVFKGDMSLVGPRPQRDGEVALYDSAAHRRLFVKPGMSGLWQVSGRSSLSWEDSIRLDLYYVENWSMAGDLVILWRTLRAVLVPGQDAK